MMNFRKSGNSVQQCKQYKSYKDKTFFERPSDAYVSSVILDQSCAKEKIKAERGARLWEPLSLFC